MKSRGGATLGRTSGIFHPGSPSLVLSQELTAVALTVTFHGTAGGLHTAKGSALDRGHVLQSAVLTLAVQMRQGGLGPGRGQR